MELSEVRRAADNLERCRITGDLEGVYQTDYEAAGRMWDCDRSALADYGLKMILTPPTEPTPITETALREMDGEAMLFADKAATIPVQFVFRLNQRVVTVYNVNGKWVVYFGAEMLDHIKTIPQLTALLSALGIGQEKGE